MKKVILALRFVFVIGIVGLSLGSAIAQPKKSPIDITTNVQYVPVLPAMNFNYPIVAARVYDPGGNHAGVQVEPPPPTPPGPFPATTVMVGAVTYALHQLHFHGPSEHLLNSSGFDMEMHLVHRQVGNHNNILVIGRWIRMASQNPDHPELDKIFGAGLLATMPFGIPAFDLDKLLPAMQSRHTYRYSGSLTAPGDMGIPAEWIIFHNPMEISFAQHNRFRAYLAGIGLPNGNASPIQDLDGRTILTDVNFVPEPSALLLVPVIAGLAMLSKRHRAVC